MYLIEIVGKESKSVFWCRKAKAHQINQNVLHWQAQYGRWHKRILEKGQIIQTKVIPEQSVNVKSKSYDCGSWLCM